MNIKQGVQFGEFNPFYAQIAVTLMDIQKSILEWPLVITAGKDGVHAPNSAHYRFQAVDIRTHDMPENYHVSWLVGALTQRLGEKFTVLLEDEGTPNEHIHVQLRRGVSFTWADIS